MDPQRGKSAASSPFVQVEVLKTNNPLGFVAEPAVRKVKCDGSRPCSNCRASNFPCETRARLSKQSTPRSYVQYLESRIRQLEGQRENEWSPLASSTRQSPYGGSHQHDTDSTASINHPKKHSLPDWSILKELGTHVIDEDGFTRYMGPSSGVGFAAKVLQAILDEDQPGDPDFYYLFSLNDFQQSRALEEADTLLFSINPTDLPPREVTDKLMTDYFKYTERVFPVLHRPTFLKVVEDLYKQDTIGLDRFEYLAQFYFACSIAYWFDSSLSLQEKSKYQVYALQSACRCYFTTLHMRRDGLTRLQTMILHSYALLLLRQRSEALRMSAVANCKALEIGLHHDGKQFTGNPLETQMRRRIFWCVFMIHLFNSSIEGLPRSLHEADITISDVDDIDDDQLTSTAILNTLPGRTKIHRFVSTNRLLRLLSRVLDVLYSHNKRRHALTKIEQMNRLCCEHLLDQLDFSFDETPNDLPHPDASSPDDLAILASYAGEQLLYQYIRWLIHRPGIALPQSDPQFIQCLQAATEAASAMVRIVNVYIKAIMFIHGHPACHPYTVFVAGLTPLYRTALLRATPASIPMLGYSPEADLEACKHTLSALAIMSHDHADVVRRRVYQSLVSKVFGDDHEELRQLENIPSNPPVPSGSASQTEGWASSTDMGPSPNPLAIYDEHHIEHLVAHDDMQNFVHDAFSPTFEWAMGGDYPSSNGF